MITSQPNLYEIVDWVETGYVSNDVKVTLTVSYKDMLALTKVEDGVFVRLTDDNNLIEYTNMTVKKMNTT